MFFPLAYVMGASWDVKEVMAVAELIGIKTFVNEFVAYERLHKLLEAGLLSVRSYFLTIPFQKLSCAYSLTSVHSSNSLV